MGFLNVTALSIRQLPGKCVLHGKPAIGIVFFNPNFLKHIVGHVPLMNKKGYVHNCAANKTRVQKAI